MSTQPQHPAQNTDHELWREPHPDPPGDYYANSIHVTAQGGIGINVGGTVIVLPLTLWHAAGKRELEKAASPLPEGAPYSTPHDEQQEEPRLIKVLRDICADTTITWPWPLDKNEAQGWLAHIDRLIRERDEAAEMFRRAFPYINKTDLFYEEGKTFLERRGLLDGPRQRGEEGTDGTV